MATLKLGKKYCSSYFLKISRGWFHARTACIKSHVNKQKLIYATCA